ncbi:Ribosomal RNA-processing protein 15 [Trichophyton interdigitale]|uniref:Ribosomal RNA-processing protein 15 n=1 Tax=Trichophyton interdigitale TaxID=101480 RepID=A0A9P4YJ46_9EURO|nr:Ribosomal RNA-processing protein 15 [Trichophyton interdigitale]KAF3895151.1 Ribosomal RNA-processing protein 15 [Trichophyton interdigitale]KAG8210032.1 Ribosomal RNA-processing protein 15 [Trichophyton interdigitale]
MAPPSMKKRKVDEGMRGKTSRPKKKFRKQEYYSSSSEDEENGGAPTDFAAVNLNDSDSDAEKSIQSDVSLENDEPNLQAEDQEELAATGESDGDDDEDSDASSVTSSQAGSTSTTSRKHVSKRNDPTAFSTSISKILSTKLPTSARADPLLSRSKAAAQTSADIANERLEHRARAKLRAEKKEELDRGRVRDVLGVDRGEAGETAEFEKKLRKVAQRGVVKLFNAVRAAQVRGEEVAREERRKRLTVGMNEREKAVNEVSKQGFLDLINGLGSKPIEEA